MGEKGALVMDIPLSTIRRWEAQGYCPWPRRKMKGQTKDLAYKCWENMIKRCTNPKATRYKDYGGRGIKVHPDFRDFHKFIALIGPRPSSDHSIDRIDNSGNYEPGNVRWATALEQRKNQRCSKTTGDGIERHGRQFRFKYQGVHQVYHSWEEAAEAKDNIYGKGNW